MAQVMSRPRFGEVDGLGSEQADVCKNYLEIEFRTTANIVRVTTTERWYKTNLVCREPAVL